ncbi:hypothetical protein [Dokdonella sp.]|uniref:hypothetical protein n=1 Tax=Dokdonella sp. TaxID=2291710 RepID=UPI0035296565
MKKRLTSEQELQRLLDEDRGEFGAIYGRLSRPEPPRRLDRIILADAARAVHGRRTPRAHRWTLALGSAAGVVLAAGIAWQVGRQMQSHESMPEGSRAIQDARVVPVEAITEPRSRKKTRSDLIMRDGEIPLDASGVAPEAMSRVSKEDKTSAASPAELPVPQAPAARPLPQATKTAQENPGASLSSEKSAPAQARSAAPDKAEAEAFAPDREAVQEESLSSVRQARPEVKSSAAGAAGNGESMESRGGAVAPQSSAAAAISADQASVAQEQLSAEAWLEEIERLASTGQRRKAIESLRLFRMQYPDWPLPDALRQLEQ